MHDQLLHRGLREPQLRGVPVGADAADAALHALGGRAAVPVHRDPPAALQAALRGAQAAQGGHQGRHGQAEGADAPGVTHGTRRRYRAGCRCLPCAHAQAVYRQGDCRRARRVDAAQARAHLDALAAHGIGLTQAARLSGLPRSTLQGLRNGQQRSLSAALAEAVLAIPGVPAMGALVKAWPTRRLLAWFRLEGFSNAEVSRRLGLRSAQLQFTTPSCRVRSAARVRALYRTVAQI